MLEQPRLAGVPLDRRRVLAGLLADEGLAESDVTVIGEEPGEGTAPVGIQVEFNMKLALDFLNQRVLSRDQLLGLLGGFGVPRL